MKKECILITGCAGMIGHQVVLSLSLQYPQYHIIGIDSFDEHDKSQFYMERMLLLSSLSNFSFLHMNLCYSNLDKIIEEYNFIGIIHLAAYAGVADSFYHPHKILQNNYLSFLNLLEFIKKYSIHTPILYASTSSVYGSKTEEKTSEKSPLNPLSSYAISKIQNEQLAQLYQTQYGLNLTGFRFFTVYGSHNRQDMLLYKILRSISHKEELTLYYNGKMKRDFTYVEDVAQVLIKMLFISKEEKLLPIYNIGTSNPVSTLYMTTYLEKILQNCSNYKLIDNHPSYDPLITYCDNTQLLNKLKGFTFTSIEEGLEKTVNWYK